MTNNDKERAAFELTRKVHKASGSFHSDGSGDVAMPTTNQCPPARQESRSKTTATATAFLAGSAAISRASHG